jgi:K+-transporting ATPase ATPase A chain
VTASFLLQVAAFIGLLLLVAAPLGLYIANVMERKASPMDALFTPLDRGLLAVTGVGTDPEGMNWKRYAIAMLGSNVFMAVLTLMVLVFQDKLPLNPMGFAGMEPVQAFNTAASFITNTNWQSYGGEYTLSYLSQMTLAWLQFTSAATGVCAAFAFIRGLAGRMEMGNFWVDMVRLHTRLLVPIAVVGALFLVWQGVPQTFAPSAQVTGPQGTAQTIPVGPAASMVAIKHLGTNGGGYYSQNSTHPLENPTPIANVAENLLLLVISVAMVVAFGRLIGNRRQAAVVFATMALLFVGFLAVIGWSESQGNPLVTPLGVEQAALGSQEGKEVRFGTPLSALFTTSTTATSTGSVNAMHDSLTPMGGFVPLANMMLNDIWGGVGVGLLNFALYAIVAVFLTGLMVGRTPEFLGKKIEKPEIVLASIPLLLHPLLILAPTAVSVVAPFGLGSLTNAGPHGFSEVLYAFTSGAANNGSAFAGLNANTPWYNLAIGVVMLLGRYPGIIALLAVAGSLAAKRPVPAGPGTLRTDTALFVGILLFVNLVVGALTFFPALALGPIADHLAMLAGKTF